MISMINISDVIERDMDHFSEPQNSIKNFSLFNNIFENRKNRRKNPIPMNIKSAKSVNITNISNYSDKKEKSLSNNNNRSYNLLDYSS